MFSFLCFDDETAISLFRLNLIHGGRKQNVGNLPHPRNNIDEFHATKYGGAADFCRRNFPRGRFREDPLQQAREKRRQKKVVPSSFTLVTSLIKQAGGEAGGAALKSGEERHRYMMHFTKFPGYRTKKKCAKRESSLNGRDKGESSEDKTNTFAQTECKKERE